MKQARAYLANQLGFSEIGGYVLDNLIIPRITGIGITINNPFVECGKEIDWARLKTLERLGSFGEVREYWEEFSRKVTPINNRLMQNSGCLLAVLDGGHAVDDGVSSEIGYYAGIKRGPIFALRSDFRCGENIAVSVNPQLLGYILESGGKLIDGQNALERWFQTIKEWYDSFTK